MLRVDSAAEPDDAATMRSELARKLGTATAVVWATLAGGFGCGGASPAPVPSRYPHVPDSSLSRTLASDPSSHYQLVKGPLPDAPPDALAGHRHEHEGESSAPANLDDDQIAALLEDDPCALGSLSLGKPNGGALVAGVQMPDGDGWEVVDGSRAWATQETIDYLIHAIHRVHEMFPGGHPLYVGHLSREGGGPMRPHRSHQSGRDADISYFYKPDMNPGWYQKASERTLDLPRTWALLKVLLTETDVEYIFITTPVQRVLKGYALSLGEDAEWLDRVFQYRSREPEPVIRHAWGHTTHMHVRFFNPKAQTLGQRAFVPLSEQNIITPGKHHARYRIQPGDDIATVARRFGTSPESIRKMNGLRTSKLMVGRIYTIPTRGYVRQVTSVEIPERRLPRISPGVDAVAAHAR